MADGCFPTPEQLVGFGVGRLRDDARAGYRADYLHDFAERICRQEIDPESWLNSPDRKEVEQEIRSIRGVGIYAANHIMMLLSQYDKIPIDSEIRKWIGSIGAVWPHPRMHVEFPPALCGRVATFWQRDSPQKLFLHPSFSNSVHSSKPYPRGVRFRSLSCSLADYHARSWQRSRWRTVQKFIGS